MLHGQPFLLGAANQFATMHYVLQAVVDDTFLGYVRLSELQSMMDQFAEVAASAGDSKCAAVFPMLVAECLACREPGLINTGVDFLAFEAAWNNNQVLQEALSVGQDPDCRGKVGTRCRIIQHIVCCASFRVSSMEVKVALA